MKATTKIQAEKIAEAGAAKMTGEYTFRPFPMSTKSGHVVKGDDTRYTVSTFKNSCNCPFYRENRELPKKKGELPAWKK